MHAIGKGIVIAEIQESSNVTYRVYDYGRLGADGKPRELHVAKALELTKLSKAGESTQPHISEKLAGGSVETLVSCPYFMVKHIEVEDEIDLKASAESFQHLMIVEGQVKIEEHGHTLLGKKGESFFISAGEENYILTGKGEVILSML